MTPLQHLTYNQSFIHKGVLHTVKNQALGMAEVLASGKLWAWPHYNGKESIKVEVITKELPNKSYKV